MAGRWPREVSHAITRPGRLTVRFRREPSGGAVCGQPAPEFSSQVLAGGASVVFVWQLRRGPSAPPFVHGVRMAEGAIR